MKKTALRSILAPLNSEFRKVSDRWRTTPIMGVLIVFFALFTIILLELYNKSLLLV